MTSNAEGTSSPERLNEFVLRFANVNGTGSASANAMVAKAFFRMGLPIGPKNMFPSNIQGLPTWYEVRVSAQGFTGRRGGVDVMVAMNAQTFSKDMADVSKGGFFLYDSTRALPRNGLREDITYLGIPITKMALQVFPNPKSRAMLQNMVYVGALSALLNIDRDILKDLVREQFAKKPNLHEPNFKALDLGYDFAVKEFKCPLSCRAEKQTKKTDLILMNGNDAAALGCVFAGATVAAWYPITPSTSLIDAFAKYCASMRIDPVTKKNRFAIIQAEDEISAVGMVLGANWNGARAFTATSGPGISLMSEFLGFAYYAEVPVVIFNIQRCGPSTGMPTRTQQADLILCAYASHGDTKHILLFPEGPEECFTMALQAFDIAERLQTPVIVMSDLELGMNDFLAKPFKWDESYKHDRGKVLRSHDIETAKEKFFRYLDVDQDGVPQRTLPGDNAKGAYFTRGSGHDKFGRYTEDGALYKENLDRITEKFSKGRKHLPEPELIASGASQSIGAIAFGTTMEPMREAIVLLKQQGIDVDVLRLRSFPFHDSVQTFCDKHERVLVIEQNRDGQLKMLLVNELGLNPGKLQSLCFYDGLPLAAEELVAGILEQVRG